MQTELPLDLPNIAPSPVAHLGDWYHLEGAQRLLRMSRTGFYRFRKAHGIGVATGRKVLGSMIVRGLERARGRPDAGPLPPLHEYAKKLKSRVEVCLLFDFAITSLYKLRVRHQVPLLPGGVFHIDDVIVALEAEQRGERRLAGPGPVRVMTRTRKARKASKQISRSLGSPEA